MAFDQKGTRRRQQLTSPTTAPERLGTQEPAIDQHQPHSEPHGPTTAAGLTSASLAAPEAERALLGAVLIEPGLAAHLLDILAGPEFYDPRHETIWDTFRACIDNGGIPDAPTVTDHLRRAGKTALLAYLPELVDTGVAFTQIDHHAETIADYAQRRRIHQLGTRLHQVATNGADPKTAVADAMDAIDAEAQKIGGRPTPKVGHIDLSWLLDGEPPHTPTPDWVIRDDGIGLFYTARINGIYGDPEAAKTWLAMLAITQALANDQRAALIDLDHNGQQETTKRLMLLGADYKALADPDRFRYYEPGDGEEITDNIAELTEWAPDVAILDSLGELIPMLGAKSTDNDEVTLAMRRTAVRLVDVGACVIVIDHLPKSKEARSTGYAIAATAKKRLTNGAYLEARAVTIPEPGRTGRISLTVSKDRSGGLREHAPHQYAGTLVLDSTTPGHVEASINTGGSPPTPTDTPLEPLMEMITAYLKEVGQPQSGRGIRDGLRGKDGSDKDVVAATKRLVEEGYVTTSRGKGTTILHHLAAMYEEGGEEPS